jgi:hypothetical protein
MREARRIKDEMAAKYGYDVRALGKAIQEAQRRDGGKYVNRRPKKAKVK